MNYSFKRRSANVIDIPVFCVAPNAFNFRRQNAAIRARKGRAWVVNDGDSIICANFLFAFMCAFRRSEKGALFFVEEHVCRKLSRREWLLE
jgi:hypothetical protein